MRKSQAEIFGVALLFVVVVLGIIIYGQIKSLNPDDTQENVKALKYNILAETTIDTVLKIGTTCEVERNKDLLIDLIKYCIENDYNDYIACDDGYSGSSCTRANEILNESLQNILNTSTIGPFIYDLEVDLPAKRDFDYFGSETYNNFGEIEYKGVKIDINNRKRYGFSKASSGLRSYPTAKRNLDFNLNIYFRDLRQ